MAGPEAPWIKIENYLAFEYYVIGFNKVFEVDIIYNVRKLSCKQLGKSCVTCQLGKKVLESTD